MLWRINLAWRGVTKHSAGDYIPSAAAAGLRPPALHYTRHHHMTVVRGVMLAVVVT